MVIAPQVKLSTDGSSLSVRWLNWTSVAASWKEGLQEGNLRVYLDGRHPPEGYSLTVQLCLPDDSVHPIFGRIQRSEGPTLYLELRLKDSTRQALTTRQPDPG